MINCEPRQWSSSETQSMYEGMGLHKHLLLAEDNNAHARLFLSQLRDPPCPLTMDRVSDGEEALAYARREGPFGDRPRPDLILLDLKMPRMDGFEVLRHLKSDPDLACIPVVILTTSSTDEDMRRAYQAGASGYVVKPFDMDEFKNLIRHLSGYWFLCNRVPAIN